MSYVDENTPNDNTSKNNTSSTDSLNPNWNAEWERIKQAFKVEIGETAFRSWIRPLSLKNIDGSTLQLTTPTRFMRDWVQTHYSDTIMSLWSQDVAKVMSLEILIESSANTPAPQRSSIPHRSGSLVANQLAENKQAGKTSNTYQQTGYTQPAADLSQEALDSLCSPLDPRFTFDKFVIGKSNELAHAAARRVTETNTVSFNPLYIYGGVGLGKTHLMHAIAWRIRETQPTRKVLYMSAEKFMYQFIRALRFRDSVTFKEQFRSVDILMIDDIQFISGKESTQEEFFHTFNALIDQNKQIIISSDRSPNELEGIQDRLKSRLGWGLVADIHPSNYDLRLNILKAKSAQIGANVPQKVLEFLAQKISSNIRELEGALNRIVAHAELVGRPITIDYTQEVLQDLLRANNRRISIDEIQRKVCEHYNLRMPDMQSARRSRNIARPRQVAMYMAKQLTSRSLPEIGRKFGGRDHTTVMHAIRKIEQLSNDDPSFGDEVALVRRSIMDAGRQ